MSLPAGKTEGLMESESSVPLTVGVSFAPAPTIPPRLGETANKQPTPSCSYRQEQHLKIPENISKGYSVW